MDAAQFKQFLAGERITTDGAGTLEHARQLDAKDPLRHFRSEFLIPTKKSLKDPNPQHANPSAEQCLYLCGNSLGLQPACLRPMLDAELSTWAARGVTGHFNHPVQPWTSSADAPLTTPMSRIVGALPSEVAVMATLTENIHFLFASFYQPNLNNNGRTKIIIESRAFPSDHYAMESQIRWHGLDPEKELVCVEPAEGEKTISWERLKRVIDENAETTAILWLSGLQYYTGQAFDIKNITAYAKAKGMLVGWDLAHAAGNMELELHEWDVDFAAWCTYKYLCSGPGGIAGLFVHDKHTSPSAPPRPRLTGWYGHDLSTRFKMDNQWSAAPGAAGYVISNPSILSILGLRASLNVFSKTSMSELRQKSLRLTGYLEHLLDHHFNGRSEFEIITPRDPSQRGAMLSLQFREKEMMETVFKGLDERGVVVDERKPDVIRVAPAPMWNTFEDVWRFVEVMREILG
ncbi:kynureninase [Ascodesmis nigricans]|uniref:Kynureninase n=1 Tax=Ascodesmis nigricans TaxID=341454 RepID=A0A4S2N5V6_9PEZI|nr:kynureninase [Ascodesmis nigricans]